MKGLSIVFSLYILILSLAPCGDQKDCDQFQDKSTVEASHTEHEHEMENCAPFCICSCCSVQVVFTSAPASTEINELSSVEFLNYQSHHSKVIAGSIWQPPKFS